MPGFLSDANNSPDNESVTEKVVVNSTIVMKWSRESTKLNKEWFLYIYLNACTAFHTVCGIS
jgi:hypothetical protein